MRSLTERQRQVLRFIITYVERESVAPTFQEIGEALGGIGLSAVYDHLQALDRKGYILRGSNQPRAITVLHDPGHPDVCPACQRPFAIEKQKSTT